MMNRLNEYRVMWILVLYDLPTQTQKQRKSAAKFRKRIMSDGFNMFQFSIYIRNCSSLENAEVHINRVKSMMPDEGHIGIFKITDKQFSEIEIFNCKAKKQARKPPLQLEFF